jgi:hypothetical protein
MAPDRYVIAFDFAALVFVAGANGVDALGAGLFAWIMLLPAAGAFWLTLWAFERRKHGVKE